jgi:hypothetical protein
VKETKVCKFCNNIFYRNNENNRSWGKKKYCSKHCTNKAHRHTTKYKETAQLYEKSDMKKKVLRRYLLSEKGGANSRKYQREYAKLRRMTDVQFRLKSVLSKRIRTALQFAGIKKEVRTMKLIGCTIEELKQHLESLFQQGMNWENYGFNGWHIDHIIPCAAFDLQCPLQRKICFWYRNLQPLWAEDNRIKSAKYAIA